MDRFPKHETYPAATNYEHDPHKLGLPVCDTRGGEFFYVRGGMSVFARGNFHGGVPPGGHVVR